MSGLVEWLQQHEPEFSEKRLPSLYSDLVQQKAANPDGFAANATTWEKALTRASLAGQLPTEQKIILRISDELLANLRSSRYGQPTGLGVVFDEGIRKARMMNLSDFNTAEVSIYQSSWIPSFSTIFQWSLRQAGLSRNQSYDRGGRLKNGKVVLLEGLELASRQVLAEQSKQGQAITDRIMSRDLFQRIVAGTEIGPLNAQDSACLLRFMSRDKGLLAYNSSTVKFRAPSADKAEPISEEDTSIASIKALMASLESQVSLLNDKVAALQARAESAVQSKNKSAALSALRSKKLAEKSLSQRNETLHQLEEVFSKIEQAVDQVQIMHVMQSSAATLKSVNQRIGGVDKVDAVMDDLREQMTQTDEVGKVMQEPLDGKMILDETEIDDEFEAMQQEELARTEESRAEAVRARLTELDGAEQATKEATTKRAAEDNAALDAEMESSSQKLERIRLDDEAQSMPKSAETEKEAALSNA